MITVLVVAIMLIEDSAPYSGAWYFLLFPGVAVDVMIRGYQMRRIISEALGLKNEAADLKRELMKTSVNRVINKP